MSRTKRLMVLESKKKVREIHIPCLCEIYDGDSKCRCREVRKLMGNPIFTMKDMYGEGGAMKTYPDNEETEALIQKLRNEREKKKISKIMSLE